MEKTNISPEEDALGFAASLFLPTFHDGDKVETPEDQYHKLIKASESGKGEDRCYEHAEVWESLWAYSVDEVIDIVKTTAASYMKFLERHKN